MNSLLKVMVVMAMLGVAMVPVPVQVTYEVILNSDKDNVFDYVSDPSNLKDINPTILDLEVKVCGKERLEIVYTEHLVQMPSVTNFASSSYTIHTNGPTKKIHSSHSTCFITRFFCMDTVSTTSVEAITDTTSRYREDIAYACPRLLSKFCAEEVKLQRALIINYLLNKFH